MPASRSMRATTLTPRSWPSRPTLATSTRSALTKGSSGGALGPGAEDAFEGRDRLADGGVRGGRLEEGGHEVDVRVRGVACETGQRRVHRAAAPAGLDVREPFQLTLFDRRVD